MKKLILIISVILPSLIYCQLSDEDFESYSFGSFDSQWNSAEWQGWFAAMSGSEISNDQAVSGVNSLKIENTDDVVALLGVLDSGIYEITFKQYVPSGGTGYINLQHNYTSRAGDWMFEVFVRDTGQGTIGYNAQSSNFNCILDEWVDYRFVLDFDSRLGIFHYNSEQIMEFPIDRNLGNGAVGLNQVNAINFFGGCGPNITCTPLAYYDDIMVVSQTSSINDFGNTETIPVNLHPNPANESFDIDIELTNLEEVKISLFTSTGILVNDYEVIISADNIKINSENIPAGLYYVSVRTNQYKQFLGKILLLK